MATRHKEFLKYLPIRPIFFTLLVLGSLALINTLVLTFTLQVSIRYFGLKGWNDRIKMNFSEKNSNVVDVKRVMDEDAVNDILGNRSIPAGPNATSKQRHRLNKCDSCFKHNFKYLVENDAICKEDKDEIKLLILIFTIHKHLNQRNAIRETWLGRSKNNTGNIRHAFLLGETTNQSLRDAVLQENKAFKDIIKEDFLDSYLNLTYKTIMGFKWAVSKCGTAKFVMKTDDDVFVNISNVMNIIDKEGDNLMTQIMGACRPNARPIRWKISKWYASKKSYPGSLYPGYCSGTGYLTSMDVVRNIYQLSPNIPFFHLEDIYVALCLQELGYHIKNNFGFHKRKFIKDPCLLKSDKLVTAHLKNASMVRKMWHGKCFQGKNYTVIRKSDFNALVMY